MECWVVPHYEARSQPLSGQWQMKLVASSVLPHTPSYSLHTHRSLVIILFHGELVNIYDTIDTIDGNYTKVAFPSDPSPGTKSSTSPSAVMSSMKVAFPTPSPVMGSRLSKCQSIYYDIIFHKEIPSRSCMTPVWIRTASSFAMIDPIECSILSTFLSKL